MAKRHNHLTKLKLLTQYGVHLWAILLLANAALVYAFHFSTQAASKQKTVFLAQVDDPSQTPNDNITPLPKGPRLDLTFTIPGIGSGGGTMNPKRTKRNLTIFLYSIDANSLNATAKPLYTIKSTADYETDTNSPLYTTFSNHDIDLGTNVQDGDYQLTFRTDESLRTLIKDTPDDIGGSRITLEKTVLVPLPIQTVLMGDTLPKEGDNAIDINDYNAFINCYGSRSDSAFCRQSNFGDFDDNGVIDGIDYNIFLRSLRELVKRGQAAPQLTITPAAVTTKTPVNPVITKTEPRETPVPTKQPAAKNGSIGGTLVSLFFLLLFIGGIGFVIKKVGISKIKSLLHLSPTGTPGPVGETPGETPKETVAVEAPAQTSTETPAPEANPEEIAASTEIPIETKKEGDDEGKSYYVKKKLPDDAKTGFWLLLTDDNGSLEAHYTTKEVTDGFAKIKGDMKTEDGKSYLEISSLIPEG